MLSTPLFSLPTDTGCVLLLQAVSKSSIWKASKSPSRVYPSILLIIDSSDRSWTSSNPPTLTFERRQGSQSAFPLPGRPMARPFSLASPITRYVFGPSRHKKGISGLVAVRFSCSLSYEKMQKRLPVHSIPMWKVLFGILTQQRNISIRFLVRLVQDFVVFRYNPICPDLQN